MSYNKNLFAEKVGYDYANKKMICKVYEHLEHVMRYAIRPTWKLVITHMLTEDKRIDEVNVNGYYSTIRKNLKDIGVIETNGRMGISKGKNWDRFYSDEDCSWFITNTNSCGYGIIVK